MSNKKFKVELEDQGQDLTSFITDSMGKILEAGFHTHMYKGGYIPISSQEINEPCMIHHPPHFNYGFLKYKVIEIKEIENSNA